MGFCSSLVVFSNKPNADAFEYHIPLCMLLQDLLFGSPQERNCVVSCFNLFFGVIVLPLLLSVQLTNKTHRYFHHRKQVLLQWKTRFRARDIHSVHATLSAIQSRSATNLESRYALILRTTLRVKPAATHWRFDSIRPTSRINDNHPTKPNQANTRVRFIRFRFLLFSCLILFSFLGGGG